MANSATDRAAAVPGDPDFISRVLDSLFVFAGVCTADGILIAANRPALDAAGLQATEVIGKPFPETGWWSYSSEAQQLLRQAIARAVAGESSRYDTMVRLREGQLITIDFQIVPMRDRHGLIYLVPSAIDITQRKKTEEALRLSEATAREQLAQLDALYRSAPVGLAVFDTQLRYLRINERQAEINGMPASDHLGRTVWEVVPALADQALDILQRVMETRAPVTNVEVRGETPAQPGKEQVWLESWHPIASPDGKVVAINMVAQEVTELKASEEALRRSEARFRALADAIPHLVWEASGEGQALYCNHRTLVFLGLPAEEIASLNWLDLLHPADMAATQETWLAAAAAGQEFQTTCRLRQVDGKDIWHTVRTVPMRDDSGRVARWFCTATEVQEQVETRQALEDQTARLQEISQRKDEFLAVLGHELRNPLSGIHSGVHLLPRIKDDPKRFARIVELMSGHVGQLRALLDDLLDMTRISRGKIELHRQPVDLCSVLGQAVESIRSKLELQDQQLQLELQRDIHVYADPTRVEQIAVNLLSNAAKYTLAGGQIMLSTRADEGFGEIRVQDTGIGIPKQMQEQIFEPFTQLRESPYSQGSLGIGLTLVRDLARLHGGTVSVFSAGAGQGSAFTVRLPLSATPPLERILTPPAGSRRLTNLRVIVVDDNVDAAYGLSMLLSLEGCHVETVHTGGEALAAAQASPPEAMLIDIGLPDMTGLDVARELRRSAALAHTLLVAVSGFGHEEARQAALAAGFDHHAAKPADLEHLIKLLEPVRGQRLSSLAAPHPPGRRLT